MGDLNWEERKINMSYDDSYLVVDDGNNRTASGKILYDKSDDYLDSKNEVKPPLKEQIKEAERRAAEYNENREESSQVKKHSLSM